MKRLCIILVTLLILVQGCGPQKADADLKGTTMLPDCVVSNTTNADYSLVIIANQEQIENVEEFVEQLIEQVCQNNFHRIKFSYEETGYPTGLQMALYLTEEDWQDRNIKPYMTISLKQEDIVDGYNIIEHYDMFQLDIDYGDAM